MLKADCKLPSTMSHFLLYLAFSPTRFSTFMSQQSILQYLAFSPTRFSTFTSQQLVLQDLAFSPTRFSTFMSQALLGVGRPGPQP